MQPLKQYLLYQGNGNAIMSFGGHYNSGGAYVRNPPSQLSTNSDSDGNDIFIKNGRYGPYLEIALDGLEKPKRATIPKHYTIEELTIERARQLLELPRKLGLHPEDQSEVIVAIGPYGPYIKHGRTYANIKDFEEIFSICLLYTSPSPRDVEESRMPSSA